MRAQAVQPQRKPVLNRRSIRKLPDSCSTETPSTPTAGPRLYFREAKSGDILRLVPMPNPTAASAANQRTRVDVKRRLALSSFLVLGPVLLNIRTLWRLETSSFFFSNFSDDDAFLKPMMTSAFSKTASNLGSSHFFSEQHALPPLKLILDPDYGGLEFPSLFLQPEERFKREEREDDSYLYHYEHKKFLKSIDIEDEEGNDEPYDDTDFPQRCTPPKWAEEKFQVCNNVHELSYTRPAGSVEQPNDVSHLDDGHFRQTTLFSPVDGSTPFVVKDLRIAREWTRHNFKQVNTEAIIMMELTGSEHTSNIYGHCGTTVLVEKAYEITYDVLPPLHNGLKRGYIAQADLDKLQKDDVHSFNNFTVEAKLEIATIFAENLADLHGFPKGAIAHDDISLGQWMRSEDGRVILNDFNNAVPLMWYSKSKRYCSFWAHYPGTFKAPEVYGGGSWVREKVDIWPMGNLIFSLLTGLKPFYDLEGDQDEIQAAVRKGAPYIDPRFRNRSFIEGRLVEIMNKCHKLEPNDRVDIFEVVEFLRETKQMYEKRTKRRDESKR